MFFFKPLTTEDRELINKFPPYKNNFEVLDYALRYPNGWLYTITEKNKDALAYSIFCGRNENLIGFVILDIDKNKNNAEAYIALHSDYFAKGKLTYNICREGLRIAFEQLKLDNLHLSLRLSHSVGFKLYSYLGFKETGKIQKVYNDILTDFITMELTHKEYLNKYHS